MTKLLNMGNTICMKCKLTFDSHEAYLAHVCEKQGFAPTQPEFIGKRHALIAAAALKRGEARKVIAAKKKIK